MPIIFTEPGELSPQDMTPEAVLLARLQQEIADESSRLLVEVHALEIPSNFPAPLYDISTLDPHEAGPPEFHEGELEDLARAARYLELRGLLRRPLPSRHNLVTFGRA